MTNQLQGLSYRSRSNEMIVSQVLALAVETQSIISVRLDCARDKRDSDWETQAINCVFFVVYDGTFFVHADFQFRFRSTLTDSQIEETAAFLFG